MIKSKNLNVYYPMEGNANDASGLNNNGIVTGATLTSGKFGQCYNFIYTNKDKIQATSNPFVGKTTFTVCCWIYLTQIDKRNQIFSAGNTPASAGIWFQTEANNRLRFDRSTVAGPAGNTVLSVNTWYHVSVVSNNRDITLYVNGVQDCTTTNVPFVISSGTLVVGGLISDTVGEANYFNGKIDDFCVFTDKALDVNDIKRVMIGLHPIC